MNACFLRHCLDALDQLLFVFFPAQIVFFVTCSWEVEGRKICFIWLDDQHHACQYSAPQHEPRGPSHRPPNAFPTIGRLSPHDIRPVIAAPRTVIPMPI